MNIFLNKRSLEVSNLVLRLGDTVLRKKDEDRLLFRINLFMEKDVLLKGVGVPVYTIAKQKSLIKIENRHYKSIPWSVVSTD